MIPREMISLIARRRLVAEIRTDSATQALSVVDALAAGGVGVFEIALTIPGASEILTHYATRSDIIVGVGAALEPRQANEALSSGARFVASPICSPEIAQLCLEKGAACVLGALTPTEIITAQRAGAEMVKLFPVEAIGGPAYVRSLLRQLTHISVQVSGGFALEHLVEYFQLPVRSIALGAMLAPPALVDRGAWQAITNRAAAFVQFASNPHVYGAQFLAMMGVGQQPQPPQVPQQIPQPVPQQPQPATRAAANLPTIPIAPEDLPQPVRAEQAPRSPSDPDFRPWDSRPVRQGDDEDWLR